MTLHMLLIVIKQAGSQTINFAFRCIEY